MSVFLQSLMRKHEEALQRLQTERQAIFHQDEVEAAMVQKGLAEQGKMEREKIRKQQTKLAKAQATRGDLSMEQQVNLLKDVQGMRRELQQAEVRTYLSVGVGIDAICVCQSWRSQFVTIVFLDW